MPRFDYDDRVRVVPGSDGMTRPGALAWVIGVFDQRPAGKHFEQFPPGVVYAIEYEDGEAADIHESHLQPYEGDSD